MTKPASKFTFDVEFQGRETIVSDSARARQKRSLTNEEIEALCARARSEGAQSAQVRASETIGHNIAALTIALRAALDQSRAEIEALREETAFLALTIASKLAPAAIAALPSADVEAVLRGLLHQAVAEPRITLSAAPAVIAAIEPRAGAIAHEEGYDGRLVLNADPGLAGADCRIDWRGGGGERSGKAIEDAIQALLARRFPDSVKG